jgi:HK97 family phage major capsid protein
MPVEFPIRDEMPVAAFARDSGLGVDTVRRMVMRRELSGRQGEGGRWFVDRVELDRIRLQQLQREGIDDAPFNFVRAIAELALPHMDPIFTLDDGTRIDRHTALLDDLGARQFGQYRDDAQRAGIAVGGASVFIPFRAIGRAVDSATSTTGGPFKFTKAGDFSEQLRNSSSVLRAGATVLSGLTGPLKLPRQTGSGVATWRQENPGSDLSRTDFTTDDGVTLSFKSAQTACAVTRQALFSAASGNYDLLRIIEGDMAAIIALALDLAALNGPGSGNQPLGLLQDTAVPTIAAGTNGAALTAALASQVKRDVAEANGDGPSGTWITNPRVREKAEQTAGAGGTAAALPLWFDGPDGDGTLLGRRAIVSMQMPRNFTKGTSTTVCSGLAFGIFERMVIGSFGPGIEAIVDPYALKNQNMIDITLKLHCDVANPRPTAFRKIVDLLTN